jgi:hypothetical protein
METVTTPSTTIRSLKRMIDRLAGGGVVTIVVYRGHPGSRDEFRAVEDWIDDLPGDRYPSARIEDPSGPGHAPVLFAVRKR